MSDLHVGTRVLVHGEHPGYISEIVPPNAVPRTVRHTAAWRRPITSYVVTVAADRTIQPRGGMPHHQLASRGRVAVLGCRRIWPNPETITPRSGSTL